MHYEVTPDLLTGNTLIDTEHKQLFAAINELLDACAKGKGRDQLMKTADFLNRYVEQHFSDEEKLQINSKYPGYSAHKMFHDGYKRQMNETTQELLAEGATVKELGKLNQVAGVLISHIRVEDRKLAKYIKEHQ